MAADWPAIRLQSSLSLYWPVLMGGINGQEGSTKWRDHFMHAPSQWETTLRCNVVSHWLGACTEGSLHMRVGPQSWNIRVYCSYRYLQFRHTLLPRWQTNAMTCVCTQWESCSLRNSWYVTTHLIIPLNTFHSAKLLGTLFQRWGLLSWSQPIHINNPETLSAIVSGYRCCKYVVQLNVS